MTTDLPLPVRDALVAVLWAAANLLLVRAAWRLREAAFPGPAGAARVLDVGVVYCGAVVLVLTFLGAAGLFSGPAMLAGVGLAAAAGLLIVGRLDRRVDPGRDGVTPAVSDAGDGPRVGRAAAVGWTLLFGLLCGHVVADGLLEFPTDFDCLMYHMPLIDHWLQAGSLYAPDSGSWFLAANSELLAAWMTGPFSGDFLVPLNNVPVVIVWAAAAVELARGLGMAGAWPHLAAFATLCVHTLLHETDDASNDLMVGAFGLAAAAYTLRHVASERRADLILFGVAVGLLAGVKYFALGYAAVCGGALTLVIVLCRGWLPAVRSAAAAAAVAVPFGGYWYLRNLFVTGLPIYPMGARDATSDLGYPDVWSTSFAGNGHPQLLELGMEAVWRMAGPVHYVAVLAAPALVALLTIYAVRLHLITKADPAATVRPLLLAVWLAGSGAVLLITPFSVEDQPGTLNHLKWAYTPVRYGLCFLSFAVFAALLPLAHAARAGHPWVGRMAAVAVAGTCLWQAVLRVWTPTEFDFAIGTIAGVDAACLAGAVGALLGKPSAVGRAASWGLSAAAVLVTAGAAAHLSETWHRGFAAHFDRYFNSTVFTRLEREFPSGARVVVFDHRPYAFFGPARRNTVVDPRFFVSRSWLEEYFARQSPDILAVGRVGSGEFNRYRGTLEGVSAIPGFGRAVMKGHYHVFLPGAAPIVGPPHGSTSNVSRQRGTDEADRRPDRSPGTGESHVSSSWVQANTGWVSAVINSLNSRDDATAHERMSWHRR